MYVQNAGAENTEVHIRLLPITMQPESTYELDQASDIVLGESWAGSAVVTSSVSVVAAAVSQSNGSVLAAHAAPSSSAPTIYAPLVHDNNDGRESSILAQNVDDTTVVPELTVNGVKINATCAGADNFAIDPGQTCVIFPLRFSDVTGRGYGSTVIRWPGASLVGTVYLFGLERNATPTP